ncbi:HYLS1 protein, partial [Polypterus senegalus]|nr:hydrolethalus syndrome protein 1 homolog [Polypterus senegalus]XP_039593776.1 hydrolethalus syndrome protein 1 homolog [Polypterus senegalus]MBN3289066.1 HYLS1 protein [Polypterus senegalus]
MDEFTEEDVREQLALLGYHNIPRHRLLEFKQDLEKLIQREKAKNQTSCERDSSLPTSSISKDSLPHEENTTNFLSEQPHCSKDLDQHTERQVPCFPGMNNTPAELDPYVRHSVATRYTRPKSAPNMLGVEDSPRSSDGSVEPDTSRSTSPDRPQTSFNKPVMKRKVLRKQNGRVLVCDESTYSEGDSVSKLEEGISAVQIGSEDDDSHVDSEDTQSSRADYHRPERERPQSAFQLYRRELLRSADTDGSHHLNRPKSFIRPQLDHPHTRNIKKTDPVAKYFQYKQDWETFRPPGENDRKALRWGIKEQMLYKSQPVKPQRIFVPNNYVVPTEKKRSALRWEVRHDMANGVIPQKMFFPI